MGGRGGGGVLKFACIHRHFVAALLHLEYMYTLNSV